MRQLRKYSCVRCYVSSLNTRLIIVDDVRLGFAVAVFHRWPLSQVWPGKAQLFHSLSRGFARQPGLAHQTPSTPLCYEMSQADAAELKRRDRSLKMQSRTT